MRPRNPAGTSRVRHRNFFPQACVLAGEGQAGSDSAGSTDEWVSTGYPDKLLSRSAAADILLVNKLPKCEVPLEPWESVRARTAPLLDPQASRPLRPIWTSTPQPSRLF